MARRGGYGSSSSISCSSSAFTTESSRIEIAFAALYLVVSLILSILSSKYSGLSKKRGRPIAGRTLLGLSISFAVFYYILVIVSIVLNQCEVADPSDYFPIYIVANWLGELSWYLLTAAILTSICRRFQEEFARVHQLILTIQAGFAGLLGALVVASLGMFTAIYHYSYKDVDDRGYNLVNPQRGVRTAYLVLAVLSIAIASASMAKSLFQAPELLRTRNITIWVSVLAICALGYTLTNLGGYIESAFFYRNRLLRAGELDTYLQKVHAVSFLSSFFYSAAFYAALRVASHRVVAVEPTSTVDPSLSSYQHQNIYPHTIPPSGYTPPTYIPDQHHGYNPNQSQNYTYYSR